MELRKHIGKAVSKYRVLEGGCYYKGTYYLCFGNMRKKTTVIVKLKAGKEKRVLGVSKPLHVGHANDCCVRHGILYITHSGKSNRIHRVSTASLKRLEDIKVKGCNGGFNGISCMGKGFLVKKMASRKCFVLDDHFRYKSTITLSKTLKVGQGMTWHDGKLYRASSVGQSHKNYVAVYNSKGDLLKTKHYDHKCELEDVMFNHNGKMVLAVYRKRRVSGTTTFQAFLI